MKSPEAAVVPTTGAKLNHYYTFKIPRGEDKEEIAIEEAKRLTRSDDLGKDIGGAMLMQLKHDWYLAYSPEEVPELGSMKTLSAMELYRLPDDAGVALQEPSFHEGAQFKIIRMEDDSFVKTSIYY